MTALTGEPICCAPTGDRCGEGVLWHDRRGGCVLDGYHAVPDSPVRSRHAHRSNHGFLMKPVTAVLLTSRDDVLAVCLGSRLILWEPETDVRRDQGFVLPNWPGVANE